MAEIRVERLLDAPIDGVFDVLSDHAAYAENFRALSSSVLTREGELEPNGLGAVREIKGLGVRFVEEITAFERPSRMDYVIREINMPVVHHGGSIRFADEGGRTRVLWTSSFDYTLRLGRRPAGAITAAFFARAFTDMLKRSEKLAHGRPVAGRGAAAPAG